MWVPRIHNKSRHKRAFWWRRLEILQGNNVSLKKTPTAFKQTLCFHWAFTKSKTLGHTWVLRASAWGQWSSVLGLKAAHTCICSAAASPGPEQIGLTVTILLPELLKPDGFWLQSSHAQRLCCRKRGSGSFLQQPWEVNVFEHGQSQENFQLDCRELNKSCILTRIQTSWIKIRNCPASLCLVRGTLSTHCLGFLQNG